MKFLPTAALVALFSSPPGFEDYFVNQCLSSRVRRYKEQLLRITSQYSQVTRRHDESPSIDDLESLYNPYLYSTFGRFDVTSLQLVDDYHIISALAHLEYGSPQQFFYGPIPCFPELSFSHPQAAGPAMHEAVAEWHKSFPLLSISQFKLNSFVSINHGLSLIEPICKEFIKTCADNPKTLAGFTFLSLSWSEIVFVLYSNSLNDAMKMILDFREKHASEFCRPIEYPIELELLQQVGASWPGDTNQGAFSTTYTTHNFRYEIEAAVTDYLREKRDNTDNPEGAVAAAVQKPPELADLGGEVYPITFSTCKPGHFRAASIHDWKLGIPPFFSGKPDFAPLNETISGNHIGVLTPLSEAVLSICNRRLLAAGAEGKFTVPPQIGEIDFGHGSHVLKTWTEIGTPILVEPRTEIPHNHAYVYALIQHYQSTLSQANLQELSLRMKSAGFPRSLIREVRNALTLYSDGLRDPCLYDVFLELFPFAFTFHCAVFSDCDAIIRFGDSPPDNQRLLRLRAVNAARKGAAALQAAVLQRIEAGYAMNELADYNAFYKGGCQLLLSVLNGVFSIFTRLADSVPEMGNTVLITNDLDIKYSRQSGAGIVVCDLHRLFEPEYLAELVHECAHHLIHCKRFVSVADSIAEYRKWKVATFDPGNSAIIADLSLCEEVFADLMQLVFAFLGDWDLYARHLWTGFATKYELGVCIESERQKHLLLTCLRCALVSVCVDPRFDHLFRETELPSDIDLMALLDSLQQCVKYCKDLAWRLNAPTSKQEFTKFVRGYFSRGNWEKLVQVLFAIRNSILENANRIFGECRDLPELVDCLQRLRNSEGASTAASLQGGLVIPYTWQPGNHLACLRQVSLLLYGFGEYVRSVAAVPGTVTAAHEDDWHFVPAYSVERGITFSANNPPLLRHRDQGGFFITGAKFRGQHLASRSAYLMSLWDIIIQEKREIATMLFAAEEKYRRAFGLP